VFEFATKLQVWVQNEQDGSFWKMSVLVKVLVKDVVVTCSMWLYMILMPRLYTFFVHGLQILKLKSNLLRARASVIYLQSVLGNFISSLKVLESALFEKVTAEAEIVALEYALSSVIPTDVSN